jgi:hypothetical protein
LVLLLGAAGCGPRYNDAAVLQGQGRLLEAARKYAAFAAAKPKAPEAPKALMAAAELYSVNLGLCAESKPLLENLARNYPEFKLPPDVFRRIFICPDYFPAGPGLKWTYGDSETQGRNARQETAIVDHTSAGAVLSSAFYAGKTLVSKQKKTYRFSAFDFVERQGGKDTVILSYPLDDGKVWSSAGPEGRLRFRVEKTGLTVKVKGGAFDNCVQVSRRVPGMPSWILEYYAPWTGKVLTSVAGKGYEHRVTELLSYEEKK